METRDLDEHLRKAIPSEVDSGPLDQLLARVCTVPALEGQGAVSMPVEVQDVRLSLVKSPEPGEIWAVEARFLLSGPEQPQGGMKSLEESARGCPEAGTLCS